jgi:hypothetical protein
LNRTELLTAAASKLTEAVALLIAAGEEKLAAHTEDLVQQIELAVPDMRPDPPSH